MTFAKLVEKISEEYSIDVLSLGEDLEIQDVAFLDNKHDNKIKHTLYFGYDIQLDGTVSLPEQCIIARTTPTLPHLSGTGNAAVVTQDTLFTIFNDVKVLIETSRCRGIFEELTAYSYTIAYYTPYLIEENSHYQELLSDMLIGTPFKNIMPRLKELHFPPKMLVLFIRSTRYMGQQYLTNFTYKNLKLRIPGIHAAYHNKGIVAVIPLKEEMEPELPDLLKDFCQKEYLQIGMSNSFASMEYFVNYYKQAYAALELGMKLKAEELVCQYQDYQIFDLFSEVKNPEQLGRFCHPALGVLRQYDHKNSSQLYKTLCVFIDKGCNIKLTSECLYIHRNSLVYRLKRMNEIYPIDFSDINTLFLLRLSFLIDRYNELNTNIEW